MKVWIVVYNHRFGDTIWPIFSEEEPSRESVLSEVPHWEGDVRDDEWLNINGPWEVPNE